MHDDLLRRLRAGRDPEALARLVELDQSGIYHFMQRRLGHRQDAEDATQEVFRRVILSLPSLRDVQAYRGWLYQIALRVAQSQIHARIDERHRVETVARTTAAEGTFTMDDSASEDRRARVQSAVDSLDDELRTVVLLRYEQGLSYEEIAEATQRPMGTVSKRLHTAHQKLQQALAAVGLSLVAGALEVSAHEAVPERLAGRLRQMALEAPLHPARLPAAKVGALAAAGILAVLFLGTPLVRKMTDVPTVSAPVAAKAPRRAASASTSTPAATPPVSKETSDASAADDRLLTAPAVVRGRVIDRETRAAVGGAEVWLGNDGAEPASRATTEADGSFVLQAPAGTYTLDALASGFARYQTERMLEAQRAETLAENESEGKAASDAIWKCFRLELKAGSEMERTVDLLASAEIRGIVVDRGGRGVPGARVSLDFLSTHYSNGRSTFGFSTKYEPDGKTSTYVTDLQGRFAIRYVYPKGSLELSVACAGFRSLQHVVPLQKGDCELTLVVDRGVSYGGRVLGEGGQPIPDACVYVVGAATNPSSEELLTGNRGEFQAADQHGGATHVVAFAPGYGPRLVSLSGQDPLQARVTLTPAESPVTGLVTDESGQPLEGVTVSVHHYEMTSGAMVVQLGFQGKFSSGSLGGPAGCVSNFLPEVFTPPNTSSQTDGAFRLEGVAITSENATFLQFSKEGYKRVDEEKVSGSGPLRIRLKKQ